MFTLFIFILLVYISVYIDTRDIEVVNSGLMKLRKNDMVVLFFVTVKHHGNQPRRAMVATVECCERVTEEDADCDLIDLYGGDFGIMQPGSVRNFTLIYPNVYGFNRRGSCLVNILHRGLGNADHGEVHHRIDFDTTVSSESVPQELDGWYDPSTLVICDSPDLDPFDHCNPVDCHLKYSGYRNFYNRKYKTCERVPTCLADPNKELPDVAYLPNSNTCRNLENTITREDINLILKGKLNLKTKSMMVDIRCHHGEIDPRTGLCKCERGWKSEAFDQDSRSSKSSIYTMCNIRCKREDEYKFLPFFAGLILGLWVIVCVFVCERHDLFRLGCRKLSDRSSPGPPTLLCPSDSPCPPTSSLPDKLYCPESNLKCSVVASNPSTLKHHYVSHLSMPLCQMSQKTLINTKSFPVSSKSRGYFSSNKSS